MAVLFLLEVETSLTWVWECSSAVEVIHSCTKFGKWLRENTTCTSLIIISQPLTCRVSWYCTAACMASSSFSSLSFHVLFKFSQALFIWGKTFNQILLILLSSHSSLIFYLSSLSIPVPHQCSSSLQASQFLHRQKSNLLQGFEWIPTPHADHLSPP